MTTQRYLSRSEGESIDIARQFAATLKGGALLLLHGDLGAGKTLFTRGIVSSFDAAVTVTSPTFSLVNVYPTQPVIYHFDLYRIQNDADLIDLGFAEYLESDGIVIVEWGEKCEHLLQQCFTRITLSLTGVDGREIVIEDVAHVNTGD
jgi:tRNA threonylcarbamoyladenosine biosynthesis protein TsaE